MGLLKVGVIGLGDISYRYIENLLMFPEEVELYACACRSIEKATAKAEKYGFKKAYGSADELIADKDVDIVLNLTIPEAHYKISLAALEAGKHVYSEKPLSATFEEGKRLLALADEKGLYLGCAPDTFMGARIQGIKKMIDEGVAGRIFGGTANMLYHGVETFHPNPAFYYQPGGGPVLDMGPYYMTALVSLLGPVEKLVAMGERTFPERNFVNDESDITNCPVHPDVMTHFLALLQFKSGAKISFNISFDVWDTSTPRFEFYGEKATIMVNDDEDPLAGPNKFGGDIFVRDEENYRWRHMPPTEEDMAMPWKKVVSKHQYDSVSYVVNNRGIGLLDMAKSINAGKKHRANGEMALHVLEVLSGILQSAKTGEFVTMTTTCDIPEALPEEGL